MGMPINEAMELTGESELIEEHSDCPQPGLSAREDFVIVAEELSQSKSVFTIRVRANYLL